MRQSNEISFKGQNIYVGIDVHLKSWSVTILSETSVLKKMTQGADPDALHRFLTSHYPEAEPSPTLSSMVISSLSDG